MDREKKIIRTSFVGIGVNLVLVLFKAGVGWLTHSIAVILDAVNNLSDALSSVITIVGTKLAGKAPDKKHPFGYGRIEYLTSMLIAAIVLVAGVTSLKESITEAIHPSDTVYSTVSLVIIAVAVATKLVVGRYVKKVGESIRSGSLIASGSDALFDALLSFATLVAAGIRLIWGWQLEGIIGALISVIIIKAGIQMLVETLNSIIGTRTDTQLSQDVKELIGGYPGVHGAYDLALHNYGPTQIIGSIHVEVDDDLTAKQLHLLTRQMAIDAMTRFGILLTVGIYAANDSDPLMAEIKEWLIARVARTEEILQMHGFYGDPENRHVMFDLIVDFDADNTAIRDALQTELAEKYPDIRFDIILDSDLSD